MHPVSLMGTGTVYTVPFFICAEGLIPSSVGGGGFVLKGQYLAASLRFSC